jgi:hypothetical protein
MSVVTGLIGIIVGAVLASWLARGRAVKEARVRHTLNLVEEFHSHEMLKSRIAAREILKARPVDIGESRPLSGESWIAISMMLHYFDKVEVMLETRWVEFELLNRLLGRYIREWGKYLSPSRLLDHSEWHDLRLSLDQLNRRFGAPEYVIATSKKTDE